MGRRTRDGTSWSLSLAPHPALFVAYTGGDHAQPATVTGRLAVGPLWVSPYWQAGRPVQVDGLVALGPLTVFASSRQQYALTIRAVPVGVQIGRTGTSTTARISYGPIPPNPFAVPVVP